MTTTELGTLERVNVRKAWSHEAYDFTPWLAENLGRLSSELGIELELEGLEVNVGSYRADIVARVSHSDDRVLIENQLEDADLQHLGQVLAYLAGLEAKIVVWVAKGFREEHLAAIRWLNEHTVAPFAFFAVQVSVVKIGDSPLAPVFEVLERPNEWNRRVQEASRNGDRARAAESIREFWAHYLATRPNAPIPPGFSHHTCSHYVEDVDLKIYQFVAHRDVGTYMKVSGNETEEDFEARIEPYRELFQGTLENVSYRKLGWNWVTTLDVGNTYDRSNWDEMANWLEDHRQKYVEILSGDPGTSHRNRIDENESI